MLPLDWKPDRPHRQRCTRQEMISSCCSLQCMEEDCCKKIKPGNRGTCCIRGGGDPRGVGGVYIATRPIAGEEAKGQQIRGLLIG